MFELLGIIVFLLFVFTLGWVRGALSARDFLARQEQKRTGKKPTEERHGG